MSETRRFPVSLICSETGKDIKFGDVLMAGTRGDVEFFSALSQDVLKHIPKSKRRKRQCGTGAGGVDIHVATSDSNFNGSYTLVGFKVGEFLYSISEKTARKFIPRHYRNYPAVNSQ